MLSTYARGVKGIRARWSIGVLAAIICTTVAMVACNAAPPTQAQTGQAPKPAAAIVAPAPAGNQPPAVAPAGRVQPSTQTEAPTAGTPVPASQPVANAGNRRDALAAARADIQRIITGTDRDDLTSLLQTAENVADEGQAYQAYLGVWQYMRLIYVTNSQRADHRTVLDRLEAIGKTFPQYRGEHYEVQKK